MNVKRIGSTFCLALALTAGCSNDPVPIPDDHVSAIASREDTGEPVAGIKIIPMDAQTNQPLASAQITGEDGRVAFALAAASDLRFVVIGGLNWQVHWQEDWDGWPAERTDNSADILLRPAPPENGLPRIAGQVVDAMTGDALDRAFISTTPFLTAYSGGHDPGADVTMQDGSFTVHEIAFAQHPVSGELLQVDLLFIGRDGYRTRTWKYQHSPGDNNLDIMGAEIELTPISGTDNGVLTGRALYLGEPVAGLKVGLSRVSAAKNGMGAPGYVAQTDDNGHFTFNNLASGDYLLHPGFLLFDGYQPQLAPNPAIPVQNDQEVDLGDLNVDAEIHSLLPAQVVLTPDVESLLLLWSPVAGVAEYVVQVDGQTVTQTTENAFDLTIPAETPSGLHFWNVVAFDEDMTAIGRMQTVAWFRRLAE